MVVGWVVRSTDQTGIYVGIISFEFRQSRVQPRVPIHILGVEVTSSQYRNRRTSPLCSPGGKAKNKP